MSEQDDLERLLLEGLESGEPEEVNEEWWNQRRQELVCRVAEELRWRYNELWEAARPFADERRLVAPSADPNTDPAVVVSLAELERLRRALDLKNGGRR